jgi:hypothetical protein
VAIRLVVLLCLGLLVAACDHGAMLVGDNHSNNEVLARATGTTSKGSACCVPAEVIAVLPPHKRLVIVELPFAGGFKIQRVEILSSDCSMIASLPVYGTDGTVVEIRETGSVGLRDEYPQSGERAEVTDRCHALPAASPSAPPTANP